MKKDNFPQFGSPEWGIFHHKGSQVRERGGKMCDFIFHLGSIHRLGDITEKHPVYSLISPNLFEDISGCQNITPNPMLFIFPNLCNLKCNSIEFAISKNSQFFHLQPEMIWHRFPNPQLLFIGNLKSALNLKFREAFTVSPAPSPQTRPPSAA